MKRPLFIALLVALSLGLTAVAVAAPLAQQSKPVIAQPEQDAVVRGVVQLVGSATHPQFQRYELYYARWPVASDRDWVFIGDAHFQQQPLGLLGTWDSRSVPDAAYGLRVRVVKQDGNYVDSDPRRVVVANTRAPDTATPAAFITPLASPTSLPPSPTIAAPTIAALRPSPTFTPPANATPILATGQATPALALPAVGELFSGARLFAAAKNAALYTLAALGAIGAFFAVKALLVWLWHKVRP